MKDAPVKTAVVTGGHSYDVVNFQRLFRGLDGIEPYVQHIDDFASSDEDVRDSYDTVVFYIMLTDGPSDEGQPWYAGKPKAALEHLGGAAQGILLLHHAILAYPEWRLWDEIVGIQDRSFGYHLGESVRIEVADPDHPITRDLSGWEMVDETYTMAEPAAGSRALLSVDHPKSMKTVAWTREYKRSRVFCLQSGHDNQTWGTGGFSEVLRRGILWCAERI